VKKTRKTPFGKPGSTQLDRVHRDEGERVQKEREGSKTEDVSRGGDPGKKKSEDRRECPTTKKGGGDKRAKFAEGGGGVNRTTGESGLHPARDHNGTNKNKTGLPLEE